MFSLADVVSCALTLAAGQWSAPLEVGLTLQGFAVTQGVAGIAAERHQSSHVEIVPVALAIDRDPRIQAMVRLELHSCGKQTHSCQSPRGWGKVQLQVLPIIPKASG